MKGDKVVESIDVITNIFLLGKTCPRNLDSLHALNIDTPPVTYSIYVRLQILIYEFWRSEIRVIKPGIRTLSMECMVCRTNNSKGCGLFKTPFEGTKMHNEVAIIDHFITRKTRLIILQASVRLVTANRSATLNNSKSRKLRMPFLGIFFKDISQLTLFPRILTNFVF